MSKPPEYAGQAPPPYPPGPIMGAAQPAQPGVYVQPPPATVVVTGAPCGGNCPNCHMANLCEEQDVCGLVCIIILVILFFPIGLLYLLCLPDTMKHHCPHCGYHD